MTAPNRSVYGDEECGASHSLSDRMMMAAIAMEEASDVQGLCETETVVERLRIKGDDKVDRVQCRLRLPTP